MWPFARLAIGKALRSAPGPSPWYLERPGTEIRRGEKLLRWVSAGSSSGSAGKSLLVTADGRALAVTDFCCYVRGLPGERILAWYSEGEATGRIPPHSMRFRVFDITRLVPISDLPAACANLGFQSRFYAATGEVASIAIPTALEDGVHGVALPQAMRDAGELLVLAESTAPGTPEERDDKTRLRLWILEPEGGRLEIIPQDWYNKGAFDFGYQWVTRMARLPNGDIVGEGIRLGAFRLDKTKRRIAEWFLRGPFYAS